MGITVKELREELADLPDDTLIILDCDNYYSPAFHLDQGYYKPDRNWEGKVYYDCCFQDCSKNEVHPDETAPCLILMPTAYLSDEEKHEG